MTAPTVVMTGHNADGKATFIDSPAYKQLNPHVGILYSVLSDGAVDTNSNADISAFAAYDPTSAGLIPKEGAVVLIAKWPPGTSSEAKIHRTLSVDVGVMIQGSVECVLDSGERKIVKTGEVLIQRGTKHYWVNPSSTEAARMLTFVLPSKQVEVLTD